MVKRGSVQYSSQRCFISVWEMHRLSPMLFRVSLLRQTGVPQNFYCYSQCRNISCTCYRTLAVIAVLLFLRRFNGPSPHLRSSLGNYPLNWLELFEDQVFPGLRRVSRARMRSSMSLLLSSRQTSILMYQLLWMQLDLKTSWGSSYFLWVGLNSRMNYSLSSSGQMKPYQSLRLNQSRGGYSSPRNYSFWSGQGQDGGGISWSQLWTVNVSQFRFSRFQFFQFFSTFSCLPVPLGAAASGCEMGSVSSCCGLYPDRLSPASLLAGSCQQLLVISALSSRKSLWLQTLLLSDFSEPALDLGRRPLILAELSSQRESNWRLMLSSLISSQLLEQSQFLYLRTLGMVGWGVFGLGGVRGGWLGRKERVGLGICGFGWYQIMLIVKRKFKQVWSWGEDGYLNQ